MAVDHDNALRQLQPIDLCEQVIGSLVVEPGTPCPCQFCAIRRVDAGYLDGLDNSTRAMLASMFSYEELTFVDRWEAILGLPPDPSLDPNQQWARIRQVRTTRNGLSKTDFEALATALGYSVTITRGVYPARAGISKAGDSVKRVNRLTAPIPGDENDIRNKTEVVSNPLDRSAGNTPITATNPYPSDFWTWVVHIDSLGSNANSTLLRERFEALKPHYSQIIWQE